MSQTNTVQDEQTTGTDLIQYLRSMDVVRSVEQSSSILAGDIKLTVELESDHYAEGSGTYLIEDIDHVEQEFRNIVRDHGIIPMLKTPDKLTDDIYDSNIVEITYKGD